MATRGWDGITNADLARIRSQSTKEPKPSKYKNVKVVVDGERFDSKKEAAYWMELKLRQMAGEIGNLQRQVEFPLYCPGEFHTWVQVASYIADFCYDDAATGQRVVIDVKGQKKRACPYPLKKRWLELQNSIVITEV